MAIETKHQHPLRPGEEFDPGCYACRRATQPCRMGDILKECVVHHSPMDYSEGVCWAEIERLRED